MSVKAFSHWCVVGDSIANQFGKPLRADAYKKRSSVNWPDVLFTPKIIPENDTLGQIHTRSALCICLTIPLGVNRICFCPFYGSDKMLTQITWILESSWTNTKNEHDLIFEQMLFFFLNNELLAEATSKLADVFPLPIPPVCFPPPWAMVAVQWVKSERYWTLQKVSLMWLQRWNTKTKKHEKILGIVSNSWTVWITDWGVKLILVLHDPAVFLMAARAAMWSWLKRKAWQKFVFLSRVGWKHSTVNRARVNNYC